MGTGERILQRHLVGGTERNMNLSKILTAVSMLGLLREGKKLNGERFVAAAVPGLAWIFLRLSRSFIGGNGASCGGKGHRGGCLVAPTGPGKQRWSACQPAEPLQRPVLVGWLAASTRGPYMPLSRGLGNEARQVVAAVGARLRALATDATFSVEQRRRAASLGRVLTAASQRRD